MAVQKVAQSDEKPDTLDDAATSVDKPLLACASTCVMTQAEENQLYSIS